MNNFVGYCPICETEREFYSYDDYWSCRSGLRAQDCPYGKCAVRERAIASTLFSIYTRDEVKNFTIHEAAPTTRGLTLWFLHNVPSYIRSGYWPDKQLGLIFGDLRNENLECQTFDNEVFDLVIHLDVMEHLFNPFQALQEIYRTIKSGGVCLFTAPTDIGRHKSEQVALMDGDEVNIVGKPEYHGNPQRPEDGALVTWRYGYDLPLLIQRETGFDVEVRRWQSRAIAVMGTMTEVYICRKLNT